MSLARRAKNEEVKIKEGPGSNDFKATRCGCYELPPGGPGLLYTVSCTTGVGTRATIGGSPLREKGSDGTRPGSSEP